MICGSGGSKSRLPKAAGAEPTGQTRDEKLHAVVARNTFRSEHVQNTSFSDHFWQLRCRKSARAKATLGSRDVEKVHAVVARNTFPSQYVKNTRGADLFWRFRCRKSARRCGAKHVWKSKC